MSEDNFLKEDRERYIEMIVNLEKKLWIPMHREPREHWESMTDNEILFNLRKLYDVDNNPV